MYKYIVGLLCILQCGASFAMKPRYADFKLNKSDVKTIRHVQERTETVYIANLKKDQVLMAYHKLDANTDAMGAELRDVSPRPKHGVIVLDNRFFYTLKQWHEEWGNN